MAKKEVDFKKIERDYITSVKKISIAKLAVKYKVPERTLEKYSSENKWVEKRRDFCGKLAEKTEKKVEEKIEQLAEKNAEQIASRNQQILEINDLSLKAVKEYFENGDYKRCLVETTKPYLDTEGKVIFDEKGKPIMCKTVEVAEVPLIQIEKVRQGVESVKSANTTSRLNEGLSTENSKQSGKVDHEISHINIYIPDNNRDAKNV